MRMTHLALRCALVSMAVAPAILLGSPVKAEVSEIRIGYQRSIAILPLIVIEQERLIEAEAQKAGVSLKATFTEFASGAPMNDAIISGNLDIGSAGTGPFLVLWGRTKGNADVKGLAASFSGTYDLVTNNAAIKSVKDFTEKDRIAVPAAGVSIQAVILQMAAAKEFGIENWKKLDHLTVSMPQPEGLAALLSGRTEITGQLAGPPFQQRALQDPKIRKVISSEEVFQGKFTGTLTYASAKFRNENPKAIAIFQAAMQRAIAFTTENRKRAAEIFVGSGRMDPAFVAALLADPSVSYSVAPINTRAFADFMHKTGRLKTMPADWRELFHAEMHALSGS